MATASERQDSVIVEHLRQELAGVIAIYRFGSTATGTSTQGSDTDIAVLPAEPVSATRRFDVQESLAARLGSDCDLVDLAGASTVMAMQVITQGRLLFESDSDVRGRFEDRCFSAYARLNEERRGILERVKAEGTVYGR